MSAIPHNTTIDYEQIIALIPGVVVAKVVCEQGVITEVHVLGDTSRHPMQLVRDIESSILAKYGIRLDRRRISVAQVESLANNSPRLALEAINLQIAGNEAEVRAELSWQQRRVTGIARGPATHRGRMVLAAQAVLRAVGELLPTGVSFTLDTLDTTQLSGEQTVLVLVTLLQNQQVQSLAGAAFVRRDETEAAGRAVLAAVNRRLGLFLPA